MDFSTNHNLQVGDLVTTMGRQVAIPDDHEIYKEIDGQWLWEKVGDGQPCIRIGGEHINTNSYRQSGLICYLPIWSKGYAILSVKIQHISNKSVRAIPLEYIELNPPTTTLDIGKLADVVFGNYAEGNQDERAIWHNKTERSNQQW